MQTSASSTRLFAVTDNRPVAIEVPASGPTVHDALDVLPIGVYSALRTFRHDRFLWLDAHFDRTERSMRALGWSGQLDRSRLRRALHETVSAYPFPDARVRFDVLREPFAIGGATSSHFVSLSPYVAVPDEFLRDGVAIELAPHLHRKTPKVKTTDFVRERRPFPLGTKGSYEHLMLDEQARALECSSSNIAFIRGRELVSAGTGVLEGITFKVAQHLAPSLGLSLRDERLSLDEIAHVDEAFLSSSSRGIVPIIQVAGQRIGTGRVGPHTRALIAAYYAYADREARKAFDPSVAAESHALDDLAWLMQWYDSNCDSDWEHSYGVQIGNFDNPGWSLTVDLLETRLASQRLDKLQIEVSSKDSFYTWSTGDLGKWTRVDWVEAEADGQTFKASGGPQRLRDLIHMFRNWAAHDGRCSRDQLLNGVDVAPR
jgi:branched-subunit amino acid aminotransferase/4-amino-4-deoxychorismate lyase